MFTIEEKQERLRLHCSLTIYQAAQLWSELKGTLGRVREIDLAEVDECDTAGVQLLLMLKRAAAEQGRSLQLVNHSKAVIDVLGLINVAGLLGDPVVLPSEQEVH